MFEDQYFSNSKLKSFELCPLQYYKQYVLKEEGEEQRQQDTLEGKALHGFAERYAVGVDVEDLMKKCFEEQKIKYNPKDISIATAKHNIIKFKENVLANYDVLEEQDYVFEIADGIFLKGIIDLIYTKDDFVGITDYKSSARKADRHRQQLQFYSYLVYRESQKLGKDWNKLTSNIFYVRLGEVDNKLTMESRDLNNFAYETLQKIRKISSCRNFGAKAGFMCRYCKHATGCPHAERP